MSKTVRKVYTTPSPRLRGVLKVLRGEKTLSEVASESGVSPSLACEWRDQLEASPDEVFAKTKRERERKSLEEVARKEKEHMLGTIVQLTLEHDFL